SVASTGHSHTFPVWTAWGSLIEAMITNHSGYPTTSTTSTTKSTLKRSNHLSSPLPTALWITRVPSSRCGRSVRAGGVVVDVMGSPQTVLGELAGQLVHGDQQQDVDDGVEQPHCRRVAVLALEQTRLVHEGLKNVGRARVSLLSHRQRPLAP